MAYLFYVDESGNPDLSLQTLEEQPLLVLAAVGIRDEQWKEMDQAFWEFWGSLGLSEVEADLTELKGREIYRNPALPQALAGFLSRIQPVVIATVIDKKSFITQRAFNDPYIKAYEYLVERIDLWARDGNHTIVLVMDSRGRGSDDRLRRLHRHFQKEGTSYQPIPQFIELPFLVDSRITPGVQIADVVAYIIRRALWDAVRMRENGRDPRPALHDPRFAALKPYMRRVGGRVSGYGLKIWPPDRWQWIDPMLWDIPGEGSGAVSSGDDLLLDDEIPF